MKHDYNREVTANAVNTHHVGFVQVHQYGGRGVVQSVVVEQTNRADAEFNVLVDGSAIFSSTQSVSTADTPETFVPDATPRVFTGPSVAVQLDVTASASFADQLRVGVLIDDGIDPELGG